MGGKINTYSLFMRQMKGKGMTKREIGLAYRSLSTDEKRKLQAKIQSDTQTKKSFRIRVYWTEEKQWFEGVCGPTTATGRNFVKYDDGERRYHYLPDEQWERIETKKQSDQQQNDQTKKRSDEMNAAETLLLTQTYRDNKATFIIQLLQRNNMSTENISLLVKSLISNMSFDAKSSFLTALCEMENPNFDFIANVVYNTI